MTTEVYDQEYIIKLTVLGNTMISMTKQHSLSLTVTINTVIKNKYGTRTKPCPVTVKVLPSFQRHPPLSHSPEQDL